MAPMSTGLIRWFDGKTSSLATMSSPMVRTCCHGEADFWNCIVCELVDLVTWTFSIGMTASDQIGMGFPVSTYRAFLGIGSDPGDVSLAELVLDEWTA